MISQSRNDAVQTIQYVVLILVDGFALIVLVAVWRDKKDAIKQDLHRLAKLLRWRWWS